MTTGIQLVMVLFSGLAFGEAFLSDDYPAFKRVLACHSAHATVKDAYFSCYDEEKFKSCVQEIDPHLEREKGYLARILNDIDTRRTECPGFVEKNDTCRKSVSNKCKDQITFHELVHDDSICQELQEVIDCLATQLNNSCADHVLVEELREVEDMDRDCKAGNFNGGDCSDNGIQSCSFRNFMADGYTLDFECNKALLPEAKSCLAKRKSKCTTDNQKEMINLTELGLKVLCD